MKQTSGQTNPRSQIHLTSSVADGAVLGQDCRLGPFAVIEAGAELGDGVCVGAHAVVHGGVRVGRGTTIAAHAVLGGAPQDKAHDHAVVTTVVIGERCVISEFCTIHRGSSARLGVTTIGDGCFVMASAHIGHDAYLADGVTLANGVLLGGSVHLAERVTVGGLAALHQGVRVGRAAMIGGGAMVSGDVPPFALVQGDRARIIGVNVRGLRALGLSVDQRTQAKRQFQAFFFKMGDVMDDAWSKELRTFGDGTLRGLCKVAR